jgi:uncharacterized membrane protein
MFRPLFRKFESASYKALAKKGGLSCPDCRAKASTIPTSADEVITCAFCGTKASPVEWTRSFIAGETVGAPAQLPASSRITREIDPSGTIVWNIPASGKSGGLIVFAILWCSITAVISSGFLFASLSSAGETRSDSPGWFLIPFFGVFWAVGLGMFYAAFRNKYARHRISANRDTITLRREFFGRTKEKSLPTGTIKSVAQVMFYQQNYEPVLGIEIRGRHGKLRFGSILSAEEKAWLVTEIKQAALGAGEAAATSSCLTEPEPKALDPAASTVGKSYFSASVTHSLKHHIPFALAACFMGALFLFVISRFWETESLASDQAAPGFIRFFDMLFGLLGNSMRVLFILIGGGMVAGGCSLIVWVIRVHGQQTQIEGSDTLISVRRLKQHRVLSERTFPRAAVTDIRSSVCGATHGIVSKRVQLIVGDTAETVASSITSDQADAMVTEVRRALRTPDHQK